MQTSNFDKNFEHHKSSFKQKFGIDWNSNHELYVQYLQTVHISSLIELTNKGFVKILGKQADSITLLELITKKLPPENG